jgi:hypothetical protein
MQRGNTHVFPPEGFEPAAPSSRLRLFLRNEGQEGLASVTA